MGTVPADAEGVDTAYGVAGGSVDAGGAATATASGERTDAVGEGSAVVGAAAVTDGAAVADGAGVPVVDDGAGDGIGVRRGTVGEALGHVSPTEAGET